MAKLIEGNWYKVKDRGEVHIGQYAGRQEFECCVCGCGQNCKVFNFYHTDWDWETHGYGAKHFPEILEDLGECDTWIQDKEG